jgi:hypothetical protein
MSHPRASGPSLTLPAFVDRPLTSGRVLTRWFVSLTVGIWCLASFWMFYGSGSGEHDSFAVAAGIVRGAQTGDVINVFCYGKQIQFVYYYLAHVLLQDSVPSSASVLLVMNITGVVASLAIPFMLVTVFRNLFADGSRAELAVLLLVTSPVYLYTLSYGHAFHVAIVLLLAGWLVLPSTLTVSMTDAARLIAAATLIALGLMMRFEAVVFLGALLWFLSVGHYRRRPRFVAASTIALASGGVTYLVVKSVFIAPSITALSSESPSLLNYAKAVFSFYFTRSVQYGVAHMVAEIGMPLVVAIAAAWVGLGRLRWPQRLAIVAGLIPSLLVYLPNPSPPRHFYIVTITLACFIALALSASAVLRFRRWAPALLLANLALPWLFIPIDARPLPERATVTYNALERTEINQAQIRDALPFFRQMVDTLGGRRAVVFGSWIHLAELSSILVEDPSVDAREVEVLPGIRGVSLKGKNVDLTFIETQDRKAVFDAVRALRAAPDAPVCLSLVRNAAVEDGLGIGIPPAVLIWMS